jgi:hypothetical protein
VSGTTSDDVLAAVTECNAGSSSTVSASLNAKVAKNIRDGVEFDANLKDQLRGEFLNNIAAKVSEANAVELYRIYAKCLSDIRASKAATS